MDTLFAVVLGVVQGATEFLPVSSTGHLILTRSVFGISHDNALAFDAVLHLATAVAVLVYFRRDWEKLATSFFALLRRRPVAREQSILIGALAVGTVPAVVLGVLLEQLIATTFRSPLLVAGVLVLGSVLFMVAEYLYVRREGHITLSVRRGGIIGCFQALALLPGMSRSGASIAGGMLIGLSRSDAARFAFLLSLPVIIGAGGAKLIELVAVDVAVAWTALALGAAVSFAVGMAAIHFMLSFVRRHTLWPFIWYRIALAAVIVLVA